MNSRSLANAGVQPASCWRSSLERKACEFASEHHGAIGQVRKYTGEAYINHPASVAELVRSVPHTEEMLAAAWLHDVVEDTSATIADVLNEFGTAVARMVDELTDVSRPEDGNRAARKAIDLLHTSQGCPQSKTVKLADLIDNTRSIVAHDPRFARIYLAEKALLLEVLREGDGSLWRIANDLVRIQS